MSATYRILNEIIANIEKVMIGKRNVIILALAALAGEGHLLVEDVPGVGKSTLVAALAKSVNGVFKRVSFTPDVLPSDITGYNIYNRKTEEFEFRSGAVDCNFLLADEINRTSPKTQSSLLEAMQEGSVSVEGVTRSLHKPFMVMATQNPVEHLGTYPLPEAQLDRFFMKISIGYPASKDESEIVMMQSAGKDIRELEAVASLKDVIQIQQEVKETHLEEDLAAYIVRIAEATRTNPSVSLGISPRGSVALGRAAKAFAFMKGRQYVLPEDIKEAAVPVLSHRIILNREVRAKGYTAEALIQYILSSVSIGI